MRTAIDLFSGCGGLTEGLKGAGFNVLLGCEIRAEAREAYKLNHPDVIVYEDVRKLKGEEILAKTGLGVDELDLLAACPPCQGFSSIRTRNGNIADDPRNELVFEVARLIREIRPKAILLENVPRLLQDERIRLFKSELSSDYSFTEGVLDARYFGVPQRRKRMIVMGSRHGQIPLPNRSEKLITVRDAIGDLPDPDATHKRPLHRIRQRFTEKVQERIEAIEKDRNDLPDSLILDCHKRYPGGFRDVYGRIAWDNVAPTITRSSHNPSKGRFIHPAENRGLTIYEIMLLQGFPRSYKLPKENGIGKLSSLLGEAFPPPMAKVQAKQIYQYLDVLEAGPSPETEA